MHVERHQEIAVLRMQAGKANAMNPAMIGRPAELCEAIEASDARAFMEAIAVAKAVASTDTKRDASGRKPKLAPNRELLGLGAANVLGSVFQGFPVAGGFSRTAVNAQAGARTGLAGVVTASSSTSPTPSRPEESSRSGSTRSPTRPCKSSTSRSRPAAFACTLLGSRARSARSSGARVWMIASARGGCG